MIAANNNNNNNSREKPDLVSQLAPKIIRASSSYVDFNANLIKIRNLQKNQYMSGDPTLRSDTVFHAEEFIPALLDKIDDFLDDIFEAEFCKFSRDGDDGQVASDVGVDSSSSLVPPGQRQYVVASICGLFQSVPFFRRCACDHFRAHLDDFMRFVDILVASGFVQKILDLYESDLHDFTAENKEVSTLLIKEIFSLVRNLASDLMSTPTPVASTANANNRGATAVAVNNTNNNNFSTREFVATVFAAPAFLGTLVRVVEILPDDVLTQMHSLLRTVFSIEPGRLTNMDLLRSGKIKSNINNNNLVSTLSTTTTTAAAASSSLLQSFFSLPRIVEKLKSVYDLSPAKSAITTSAKKQTSFRHWMFLLRCFAQFATDEAIITSLLVVDDQTSSSSNRKTNMNNCDDNKDNSDDRHRFKFFPNMLVAFFSQLSVEVELAHPICRILSLFQKPAKKTQKSSTSHGCQDSKSLPIQFLETEMFKLLNSPFPMFSSDYNGDNKNNNNNNNARVEFQTAASNHHHKNNNKKNSADTKTSSATQEQEQNESQSACATPLQIAAFLCDSLVCELLIGAGANVDGRILMMSSNNSNCNDDDVKTRSKKNIQETASAFSPTVYGQDQMTPLILAISSPRHRCDVVSVLLDADFRSTGNASGFYFSSDIQDKNSSSLLLFYDALADAMLPDAGGCSPYEYANDEPKCAKCLATIEKAIRWQRPL